MRRAVADAARHLAAAGLLVGTAGNVSLRAGERVAVTASGVVLGDCTPDDVTVLDLGGAVVEGRLRPTSELDLHLGAYAAGDHAAVVHTHAPWSTAVACVLDELPVVHYQQLLLGGAVRVAPYATFGTPELAAAVTAALEGRQAALLANHGSVAVGPTLAKAVEHAELLEWLAALHHRAAALGTPRVLTEQQQAAVVEAAVRRRYGTPQELDPQEES
ncbi:class II aldolase/adducin family protein [Nocardioides sp. zg-579]|uniref:Class II aldolase/adducin family protein n=2 Tax=Nocardioides marmotae TaxID=2663857 RepID=A0A6I3JCV1_9ACTN|nr:class II aldolase/adducin family protein [Gordonia jinghuaiqii]MTB95915.1 class II aldolase/adducin family protein [Nocardioides marmotae]QKE03650.1 class II aldolase/adducin family protein [Nocardioides marmotae]